MTDRPAAIRRAVRTLVARAGFHGASMGAIAAEAGVAAGTAYVHYPSKDELIFATYLEVKRDLGIVASGAVDAAAGPRERFLELWIAAYRHLADDRDRARFLVQFDASPYAAEGHARAMAVTDDPLADEAQRPDLAERLVDLPALLLYDLALGPAVRAAAAETVLDDDAANRLALACWRAVDAS